MDRAAHQEAFLEEHRRKLLKAWYQERIERVHRSVSAYDILGRNGVALKGSGAREEQFSCPFHGADRKPSARYYPESPRSPSHAWCFVCQEQWDAIGLWRKFNDATEKPFGQVLGDIERAYGMEPLPVPSELKDFAGSSAPSQALMNFDTLMKVCEARLKTGKGAYRFLNDRAGYLSASSILDKLQHRVSAGSMSPEKGIDALERLIGKINEKIRSCPEG